MAVIGGKSVYLDDAGHPMDKPYLVLGGFIASEAKWNEFGPAWEQTLKSRQVESPFHATDFFSRHKNDRKLKHITADLIQTIATYAEWAFSIALDLDVYRRINRQKRLEELAGSPLALVSRSLRRNIEYYRELRRDGSPILYFIESGTFQYGDMAEVWRLMDKKEPPIQIPKSHPAAQAADLYAYSVYQSAPFEKGRLGWQHKMFADHGCKTFGCLDGRVMEQEMSMYLNIPTTVINDRRVFIPGRAETEGLKFEFDGNKNKQQKARRARIGLYK